MKIDLTKLIINSISTLKIDSDILIPDEFLKNTLIYELKNTHLNGKITINENDEFVLTGTISGTMTLKDDVTLEPVEYTFKTEIEEILDKLQNTIDITDVLWQNILVEIPSKVRTTDEDIEIYGEGWRVITEEQFTKEMAKSNNPFSNLEELLNKKEEK